MARTTHTPSTKWTDVQSNLTKAFLRAPLGAVAPEMNRFRGIKRMLARKTASVVSYLSSFLTRQQREYNDAVAKAVESLAHGMHVNEKIIRDLQSQYAAAQPPAQDSTADVGGTTGNTSWEGVPTHDFSEMLHALRGRMMKAMPPGGQTILSGGCAGGWYFRWFAENYPTVTRHIGIEAYSPKPDDLPENVEWHADTLGHMNSVKSEEIDLVFSGQTMEHIWPYDITNFLLETHRVLKPGGWVVLDSPNRRFTHPNHWVHPEHTVEYTVDEIVDLMSIAGFDNIRVKGIWLCYDYENHRVLSYDVNAGGPDWPARRRMMEAEARPADSFIWWVEGQKSEMPRRPDACGLYLKSAEIYDRVWPIVQGRLRKIIGEMSVEGKHRILTQTKGTEGNLLHGPASPLRAGSYEMAFRVAALDAGELRRLSADQVVATMDVYGQGKTFASRPVLAKELRADGYNKLMLPFQFDKVVFGTEFRLFTTGTIGLKTRFAVEIVELD